MSTVFARFSRHRVLMPLGLAVCAVLLLMGSLSLGDRGSRSTIGERGTSRITTTKTQTTTPGRSEPIGSDSAPRTADGALGGGIAAPATDADRTAGAVTLKSAEAFAEDSASIASTAAPTTGLAAPDLDAHVIRTASVQLRAGKGAFEDAWGGAQATAGAFGGYVTASSRSGSGSDARSATIVLRVPAARFDAAVARLRKLDGVKVEGLDISSQDASEEYVDTASRLKHDRAVEARLLSLLADTKGVSEVLAVQARLDQVQEQIEVSAGRVRYLDQMTSMSTIDVTLRQQGHDAADEPKGDSMLAGAFHDAGDRLLERVSGFIVWVGGALPTLLVLAFVLLTGRFLYRRNVGR
ncbi:MAG: hypothetical protein JWN72_1024 [Thermoleophilia bacterium]|nr:hypothetical protein [Thermoleophilia bacterium]